MTQTIDRNTTKKNRILDTAAKLFSQQPFHKVLLSDVAQLARVGKGTLYLYFESKDDLYFAVLFREFSTLVQRIQQSLEDDTAPADEQMRTVVRLLAEHICNKASNVEAMGVVMKCPATAEWSEKRQEFWGQIQSVIDRGVNQGLFADTTPELTAMYIGGLIRSVCLFKPENANVDAIHEHACNFVLGGLRRHS